MSLRSGVSVVLKIIHNQNKTKKILQRHLLTKTWNKIQQSFKVSWYILWVGDPINFLKSSNFFIHEYEKNLHQKVADEKAWKRKKQRKKKTHEKLKNDNKNLSCRFFKYSKKSYFVQKHGLEKLDLYHCISVIVSLGWRIF